MWKCCGADGGIADGGEVDGEQRVAAEGEIVERGDFHKEVVGVLAVGDGAAIGGFSLLKEQRVLAAGDGCGLKREHGAEGELAWAPGALRHGHEPACGEELVFAARAALLRVSDEGVGVKHEHPVAAHGHEHGSGRGGWLEAGAGGGVFLNGADEAGLIFAGVHVHLRGGAKGRSKQKRDERG